MNKQHFMNGFESDEDTPKVIEKPCTSSTESNISDELNNIKINEKSDEKLNNKISNELSQALDDELNDDVASKPLYKTDSDDNEMTYDISETVSLNKTINTTNVEYATESLRNQLQMNSSSSYVFLAKNDSKKKEVVKKYENLDIVKFTIGEKLGNKYLDSDNKYVFANIDDFAQACIAIYKSISNIAHEFARCTGCDLDKEASQFKKASSSNSGLSKKCISCLDKAKISKTTKEISSQINSDKNISPAEDTIVNNSFRSASSRTIAAQPVRKGTKSISKKTGDQN